ncbi:ABC transporter ATP-binding protein [Verrucomicrobia bacterium]|nr:ABC transporter ATP-binding protein [Verrucomicrobiota bacterium]
MKNVVEINDLKKSFRKTEAVNGLSMEIPPGVVTAFLGPNGAGKTTTIKCLLNLLEPTEGSISVLGQDSTKLGPGEFSRIGYVSENQELPLWMTVRQLMDYCRPLYDSWDVDFEKRMLKDFELPLDAKLKALSRGMRMKASLLSSLAFRPRLVVLDEPFSGLDPLVRDEFIRGLLELTEDEGWTVMISSHDIEEVERLADRVAIINRGKLQLHEGNEELQARFRRVEVGLPNEAVSKGDLPESWLNFQQEGRHMRWTHSRFEEGVLGSEIQKRFGSDARLEVYTMTLREIFVELAKTYRLDGSGS